MSTSPISGAEFKQLRDGTPKMAFRSIRTARPLPSSSHTADMTGPLVDTQHGPMSSETNSYDVVRHCERRREIPGSRGGLS